jgi:peptidoglycan/xylan/chitin deacetylase (PgdA/CDA1 family)
MYHGLVHNNKKIENKFFIDDELFRKDIKFLKHNGYNSVGVNDLINFVHNDVPLPEKSIMVMFDDGYLNNFLYAFPIIKEENFKAVFSPIGKCVEDYSEIKDRNPYYAHANWNDIREMSNSGLVEIQNHSYNMHSIGKRKGCKKMRFESDDEYKKKFKSDVLKFQSVFQDNLGKTPEAFVYPFGATCHESENILKELGFKATFSCEGKINTITSGDPDSLYRLGRIIRPNKIESEKYFKKYLKNEDILDSRSLSKLSYEYAHLCASKKT